jgi:hypothetical protein
MSSIGSSRRRGEALPRSRRSGRWPRPPQEKHRAGTARAGRPRTSRSTHPASRCLSDRTRDRRAGGRSRSPRWRRPGRRLHDDRVADALARIRLDRFRGSWSWVFSIVSVGVLRRGVGGKDRTAIRRWNGSDAGGSSARTSGANRPVPVRALPRGSGAGAGCGAGSVAPPGPAGCGIRLGRRGQARPPGPAAERDPAGGLGPAGAPSPALAPAPWRAR